MLSFKRDRLSPGGLYLASVISLLGFVTNRLNISVIGFETYVGHRYVPKWTEFMITLMIIAMGFALFRLAVQYLPIFPEHDHGEPKPGVQHAAPVFGKAAALSHAND
jgi:Ni/Fe-hydrogenase subunit HybB-like protein